MKKKINMYFALAKSCNLGCKYCYLPPENKKQSVNNEENILLRVDEFITKIDAENYQIGSFCFHGAEPTTLSSVSLGSAANKIYRHWKNNKNHKNTVAIQSNGTLLTKDYLTGLQTELKDNRKIRLGFSIDPPGYLHNKFRNNTFDLVMENLHEAINMGFPVSVLSVVTNQTMDCLADFTEWMRSILAMKLSSGNPYKIKLKFATGKFSLSQEQFTKLGHHLVEHDLAGLVQILTPGYCIQSGNDCEWFEFGVDGGCYSCNKTFNDMGNFASWRQQSFNEIIKLRMELFSKHPQHSDCLGCPHELICNSGCPADRIMDGVHEGKAHECPLIKSVLGEMESKNIHIVDFYNNN